MTREQAIKIIEDDRDHLKHHLTEKGKAEDFYQELGDTVIAYNMAISALEKENIYDDKEHYVTISKALYDKLNVDVCDDVISRRAVLELVADYDLSMGQVVKGIHELPSVQPSRKGYWKSEVEGYYCSKCYHRVDEESSFCPDCGADMREESK